MAQSMTIVIPSCDRAEHLAALIDSIARAVEPPGDVDVDVHVVLDGSRDGSAALLERLAPTFPIPLTSTWTENRGPAAARNTGIAAARGELAWLVDDDMLVTRTALLAHLEHDRDHGEILMGPCLLRGDSAETQSYREFYGARHDRLAGPGRVTSAQDFSLANTSAPTALLRAHPLDERFTGYGMEDYDVGVRLLAAGVRVAFGPDAAIVHDCRPTRSERLKKLRQEGGNRVRFASIHPDHVSVAFPPSPPRGEQAVRKALRPRLARPLWTSAHALDRAASAIASRQRPADRLRYLAEVCAVYSGVASAPAMADVLHPVTGDPSKPWVSFVIPALDAAATIDQALQALRDQSVGRWEAVVVDDGSTDATATIVARWAHGDGRFRLIDGPGRGVSAARNAGLDATRHDWVVFLDADDRIDTTFVEKMTAMLAQEPDLDGVRCQWAYETPDRRFLTAIDWELNRGVDPFEVFAEGCSFAIHACMVRRRRVLDVGGFDTNLVVGEDWDLWQKLTRQGLSLAVVPETLAFYVMRPASAMHRNPDGVLRDMLTCYRRGHSNDARVGNPRAQYRDGAPLPARDVVAENVLGCAAVALSEPGGAWSFPRREPDGAFGLEPAYAADIVFDAVPFGRCVLASDWLAMWPQVESEVRDLLTSVAEWCGSPQIVRPALRRLERKIILETHADEATLVGATLVVVLDVARPIPAVAVEPGTERLIVKAHYGGAWLGFVELPVLGDDTAPQRSVQADRIADVVERELGLRLVRAMLRRPRGFARVVRAIDGEDVRRSVRFALDFPVRARGSRRQLTRSFVRSIASDVIRDAGTITSRDRRRDVAEPTIDPYGEESSGERAAPVGLADGSDGSDEYGRDYFEQIFTTNDPWFYTSGYEQTKYTQTLSLIDGLGIDRALELACAEGHFTEQLAPVVGRLVATDISDTALVRAAERCSGSTNIEFRKLDLRHDALPAGQDLIVCSEVLYYIPDEDGLRDLGRRFGDALVPGGHVLMAHANLLTDEPDRTGFDWGHPFGGKRLGEIVSSVPGLHLVTEIITPLYRIQLIRRTDGSAPLRPTERRHLPHAPDLDSYISRMVIWGGAVVTPSAAIERERTERLPILMYHRVDADGPEALAPYRVTPERFEQQLDHLRRHGYYGITLDRWRTALAERRPVPGRAVLLTFDDGYVDFAEQAWPLLDAYGFPATVFVVAGLVGGRADWDAAHGEPASLMTWRHIRELHAAGVEFGSHAGSHRPLTSLSPSDALHQEIAARHVLDRELGHPVTALAYPYGAVDAVVRQTMVSAGYTIAVGTDHGRSSVWDDAMNLPRIEIDGTDDLPSFVDKLGSATPHNPLRRGLDHYRRARRR